MNRDQAIAEIRKDWKTNPRWQGINRPYSPDDVYRLRGTVKIEYSLAQRGAGKLWTLLHQEPFVNSLGALTGNQAMQQVKAGLKAIYLSGWQVAADANTAGGLHPRQPPCSGDSASDGGRQNNKKTLPADQTPHAEGKGKPHRPVA